MAATLETYFPGGFDPAHPAGNRAECWDLGAGTYTAWAPDGTVRESRAMTAVERAQYGAPADPLASARAVLAAQADPNAVDPPVADVLTALAQVTLGSS